MTSKHRGPAPEADIDRAVAEAARPTALNADLVAGYLRRHPEFLAEHPDLLDVLMPPARSDLVEAGTAVVDLQQAMVMRWRSEAERLRLVCDELITNGRINAAIQGRIHDAVLALLAARSFEHLMETIGTDLPMLLDLDAVYLCVEQAAEGITPVQLHGVRSLAPHSVAELLGPSRAVCLRGNQEGEAAIFGPAAGVVASDALLRLSISKATPPALLALGSRDPTHFEEGQGTELLQFLARSLEHIIRAWLELPE
ncbi:MAG TPA: DUF484 family protein [Kiloniellales bacterium]|jgi:uncharacterized protein YigA (DUF484 family)|nr:DUF484 family protein [Kiloniellales bacterium]